MFNLVITAHNDAREPAAGVPIPEHEVLKGFAQVNPKARQIIHIGKDWKYWGLCDREPVQNWVDGRVALLGDAAHPMLQYMAQGACMAMEDAVCLAHMVDAFPDYFEKALVTYRDRRVLRTTRMQLQSRAMGERVYHPDGAHAELRNSIRRSKTQEDWYEALAWLYGSNGLDENNFGG